MKKYFILCALFIGFVSNAQKQEVQKTIETFFKGFHAKDTLKMKSMCSEKLILQSISESLKGTKLSQETAQKFYTSIATIPSDIKFEERILCELTPPLTDEGRSEFWEALGRRFTGLPYQEADLLRNVDEILRLTRAVH